MGPASHMDICERLSKNVPEMGFPCDRKTHILTEPKNFAVNVRSRKEWAETGLPNAKPNDWICFTDGSRHGDSSGSGYYIQHNSSWW